MGAGCAAPLAVPPQPPAAKVTEAAPAPSKPEGGAPSKKTLYLTFDADMTPAMVKRLKEGKVNAWYDPALIAFLRDRRIPATVFMTGLFAETYPDLTRSLAADRLFSIQNHTYDHSAFEASCYGLRTLRTDAQKRAEIVMAQDALRKIAGLHPRFFRYPGLCHDAHDDAMVADEGLTVSDGDIVSGDAFAKDPDAVAAAILRRARDGGEVVLHLGGPNAPSTLRALQDAVPKLEAAGYGFSLLAAPPAADPRKAPTSASR